MAQYKPVQGNDIFFPGISDGGLDIYGKLSLEKSE